jgi:hypothetical protein
MGEKWWGNGGKWWRKEGEMVDTHMVGEMVREMVDTHMVGGMVDTHMVVGNGGHPHGGKW